MAKEKLRKIVKESAAASGEQQKQASEPSDAAADAQVQVAASKWFRFFITHDPKTVLRKVKCPVLAINGELDKQVLAQENLPAIEQALREGGNTHFTIKELPGLNHLFQTAKTGNERRVRQDRRDHVAAGPGHHRQVDRGPDQTEVTRGECSCL